MAEALVHTFCRLCEVNCGLEARVDAEGRLAALRPDHSHPIHAGFACHKGLLALELHRDPDRLNAPQRRIAPGHFETSDWETAIQDVARRLQTLRERHGPDSVALYMGNPSAFNALGAPHRARGPHDAARFLRITATRGARKKNKAGRHG